MMNLFTFIIGSKEQRADTLTHLPFVCLVNECESILLNQSFSAQKTLDVNERFLADAGNG
jgi:hypothetical protein